MSHFVFEVLTGISATTSNSIRVQSGSCNTSIDDVSIERNEVVATQLRKVKDDVLKGQRDTGMYVRLYNNGYRETAASFVSGNLRITSKRFGGGSFFNIDPGCTNHVDIFDSHNILAALDVLIKCTTTAR